MILVGKIASELVLGKSEYNVSVTTLTLAIPRSNNNEDEECDTDFIPITLYGVIAEETVECCKKGDIVSVKGRLSCLEDKVRVVAEKINSLTNSSKIKAE